MKKMTQEEKERTEIEKEKRAKNTKWFNYSEAEIKEQKNNWWKEKLPKYINLIFIAIYGLIFIPMRTDNLHSKTIIIIIGSILFFLWHLSLNLILPLYFEKSNKKNVWKTFIFMTILLIVFLVIEMYFKNFWLLFIAFLIICELIF